MKLAGQRKSVFINVYSSLANALPWLVLLIVFCADWTGYTFCRGKVGLDRIG